MLSIKYAVRFTFSQLVCNIRNFKNVIVQMCKILTRFKSKKLKGTLEMLCSPPPIPPLWLPPPPCRKLIFISLWLVLSVTPFLYKRECTMFTGLHFLFSLNNISWMFLCIILCSSQQWDFPSCGSAMASSSTSQSVLGWLPVLRCRENPQAHIISCSCTYVHQDR